MRSPNHREILSHMTAAIPLGLLVEAEQFVPFVDNASVRIVDLSRASVYEQLHLPGAISIRPSALIEQQETITGLLPDQDKLQQLIEHLRLSPEHHVLAYDDEEALGLDVCFGIFTVRGFTKPVF